MHYDSPPGPKSLLEKNWQKSGTKSLTYDNILTEFNTEAIGLMYNIGRYVRSVIYVETVKNSNKWSLKWACKWAHM